MNGTLKGQVIRAACVWKLPSNKRYVASSDCLLPIFPRTQQIFMFAVSTFCNMKTNLLRLEVVIRGTIATCNATFVSRQVARKCSAYYVALHSLNS